MPDSPVTLPARAPDTGRPTAPPAPSRPAPPREPRLDVFRGLCLVMIFINHVPGNLFEGLTSRNFGFSDAAEGFVLMSGTAAGLAYSSAFRAPLRLWPALARIWGRVWTLYLVQMLMTLGALAMAAATVQATGDSQILFQNNMGWLWHHPVETLIGLPLLTHQFYYLDILPLYILLLAASPLFLYAALRRPGWLFAGALAVWAGSGIARITFYTWPVGQEWQFNPLAWQLIFVIGLLLGVALKQGRRLVAVKPWLLGLSLAYLLLALVDSQWHAFTEVFGKALWYLKDSLGVPWILTDFDKKYLTAPRLLHVLAIAYIVSSLPWVRRLCASRWAAPLALLGQQALPVFALGSVLAIGAQGLFNAFGHEPLRDTMLIGLGLALQLALAQGRSLWAKARKV